MTWDASDPKAPFRIRTLTPIQVATFALDEYRQERARFSTDEWLDLLMRSIGYEPSAMARRTKFLFLARLIPLCEQNYNLVEFGPRGTGKSYAMQELSPYTILMTGPTTVANLFYNMASGKMGLIGLWDAIAFDEAADLQKMPKEVVTTLKTYCESGTFARGQDSLSGLASIALFGNLDQSVEDMVRSSHLFMPMPEVVRDDLAFLDRIHCYLPGWEIPKMRGEFFTEHVGFVVEYLAEALRELRKDHCTEVIDRHFSLGSDLNARDENAVRKTVSGLVKLIYPHGEFTQQELAELVEFGLEGRRRVKEQLKKMDPSEYGQTSFSYRDRETGVEWEVGVPEQEVATAPLAPGCVDITSFDRQDHLALDRWEGWGSPTPGQPNLADDMHQEIIQAIRAAYTYRTLDNQLVVSRDLQTFHPETCFLNELFVKSILKTKSSAFVIERSLAGPRVKKTHELAHLFQAFAASPGNQPIPCKNFSDSDSLLSAVLTELNFRAYRLTGHPLSVIRSDGLLEGEWINDFIARVRQRAQAKAFQERTQPLKKQVTNNIRVTKTHLARLAERTPGLYAVRKTLRYAPMRIGGSPPLEDTERHRQRFAHGLFTELPQLALLDWWWKRDYMTELGYYYHVVFLIDRQKTRFFDEPFLVLDERWQQATDGWGAVETHLSCPENPKSWGTQWIGDGNEPNRAVLLSSLIGLLRSDLYLRLPETTSPHFGMERGPKAASLARATPVRASVFRFR